MKGKNKKKKAAKKYSKRKVVILFEDGDTAADPANIIATVDGVCFSSEDGKEILEDNSSGKSTASASIHMSLHVLGFIKYMLTKDEEQSRAVTDSLPAADVSPASAVEVGDDSEK